MAETQDVQSVAARETARDRGLRRRIGTFRLSAAIVNGVVGAGIFALPGGMARAAGPYAFIAYLICALAMAAVVLCCAEAGSRVPTSGGIYGYVDAAFGPLTGFVSGVLLWLGCVLACGGIASAAAEVLGRLSPGLAGPGARAGIIVVVIGTMMAVNCIGVSLATRLIAAATAVKLIPLGLFLVVGALHLDPAKLTAGAHPGWAGVGRAVILSLFAFQGMETALAANGEVDRPAHTLPRALIAAMAFVALLYVAVQFVAQGLLGRALAASTAPLVDGMARIDPRLAIVVLAGTAVSMCVWIGTDLLGAPRVLFAFARDGFLPQVLGRVSARGRTPIPAILAHGLVAIALAVTGTFEQLAVLSVLATSLLYIGACAAAWRLERKRVALLGPPLRLPGVGVWAVVGGVSMAVVIALGRPAEIAALVGAVIVSCGLYWLARRLSPRHH